MNFTMFTIIVFLIDELMLGVLNITHSTLNIAKAQQYFDLFYRGPIMVSHRLRFRAAIYFCPRWWGLLHTTFK